MECVDAYFSVDLWSKEFVAISLYDFHGNFMRIYFICFFFVSLNGNRCLKLCFFKNLLHSWRIYHVFYVVL